MITMRRHPADVTADRPVDDAMRYNSQLTPYESDAIGHVINALREIAEGSRDAR